MTTTNVCGFEVTGVEFTSEKVSQRKSKNQDRKHGLRVKASVRVMAPLPLGREVTREDMTDAKRRWRALTDRTGGIPVGALHAAARDRCTLMGISGVRDDTFWSGSNASGWEYPSELGFGEYFSMTVFVRAEPHKAADIPTQEVALERIYQQAKERAGDKAFEYKDAHELIQSILEFALAKVLGARLEQLEAEKRAQLANSVLAQCVSSIVDKAKERCRFKERLAGLYAEFEAHKETVAKEELADLEATGIQFDDGTECDPRITEAVKALLVKSVKDRGIPSRYPFGRNERDAITVDQVQ